MIRRARRTDHDAIAAHAAALQLPCVLAANDDMPVQMSLTVTRVDWKHP